MLFAKVSMHNHKSHLHINFIMASCIVTRSLGQRVVHYAARALSATTTTPLVTRVVATAGVGQRHVASGVRCTGMTLGRRALHVSTGVAAGGDGGGRASKEGAPLANQSNMEGGVDPSKSVVHPYVSQNARYLPGFSYPAPRELSSIIKYSGGSLLQPPVCFAAS